MSAGTRNDEPKLSWGREAFPGLVLKMWKCGKGRGNTHRACLKMNKDTAVGRMEAVYREEKLVCIIRWMQESPIFVMYLSVEEIEPLST